jgi:hypothetical protein
MRKLRLLTALLAISASLALPTPARGADDADLPLDAAMRIAVLESVAERVSTRYVRADVGARVAQEVRARAARGEFDGFTTARPFCERVTAVLAEASLDKHLKLVYSVRPRKMKKAGEEDSPAERARARADAAFVNFGFHKVERLRGNIGYLEFERFMDPSIAGETAAAAMAFLAHTDALILDLRGNGGGTPMMVAFLASYLFPEPVHLNDIAGRIESGTKQIWTLPYVPGSRFDGKDVYVLTSRFTFSGAEELAYDLKSLKRATLVGETTRGGANPGSFEMLNEHFAVFVPSGRAVNPVTKTNWEGTGVTPDIAVPADQALKTAYRDALEKAATRTADPQRRESFREWIATTEKELDELRAKGAK